MLIKFRVTNSRSIENELIFSMIATNDNNLPQNTTNLPKYGVKLLKTMALFGANASGKSNILKAISDSTVIILNKKEREDDVNNKYKLLSYFNYCKNNESNKERPIRYSYDILIEGALYNYTFAHDKEKIIEETVTFFPNNTESEIIFSRKLTDSGIYEWTPLEFFADPNVQFFHNQTPNYRLFLDVVNTLEINQDVIKRINILEKIYKFYHSLHTNTHIGILAAGVHKNFDSLITYLLKSKSNKKTLLKIAKVADIDITDLYVIEIAKIIKNIRSHTQSYPYTRSDGNDMLVSIKTAHDAASKTTQFDFFIEESNGTQQFFAWIGEFLLRLQEKDTSNVFIIDELGTNLHPLLTRLLVAIFASKKLNPHNAQLIFTTHEVKLMDNIIMRPDQLCLLDKIAGNTLIKRASDYPLDQYDIFDNIYLQGAVAGVPHTGRYPKLDELL